jgi:hypothetical protein
MKSISASLLLAILLNFCPYNALKAGITYPESRREPAGDTILPLPEQPRTDRYFSDLLEQAPEELKQFLHHADSLRIQIIFTRIDRAADNTPAFTRYFYHVTPGRYFYPASTVKLPVALLALQRLNELKVYNLDEFSTMITESTSSRQTPVYNDPAYPDGRPSVAGYIKKILLVSDNDAFNRLYEFLGQEYVNRTLHAMGYQATDILHRLSLFLSEEENRRTNPVTFLGVAGKTLYSQPMQVSVMPYPLRKDSIGKAHYTGSTLVSGPMDFSKKNRILLEDLTSILQSVIFPASVPQKQRFNIRPDQYAFLLKYMSQYPTETTYPTLDSSMQQDAFVKFLLHGATKTPLPKTLRIFNKVGDAYGFLTDVAYVADLENKVEFMLSASIYCNTDGILNDSRYDYETIGFPFMKLLGNYIYEVEKKRKRTRLPDLSKFSIHYDK